MHQLDRTAFLYLLYLLLQCSRLHVEHVHTIQHSILMLTYQPKPCSATRRPNILSLTIIPSWRHDPPPNRCWIAYECLPVTPDLLFISVEQKEPRPRPLPPNLNLIASSPPHPHKKPTGRHALHSWYCSDKLRMFVLISIYLCYSTWTEKYGRISNNDFNKKF